MAGLLMGTLAFLLSPAPAGACLCIMRDIESALANADVVFSGTAVERRSVAGAFSTVVTLDVDWVWMGEVPAKVFMTSGRYDAETGRYTMTSCDDIPPMGRRSLVFARRSGDYYSDWACSGSEVWADPPPRLLADLVEALGEGHAPRADLATHAPPDADAPPDDDALPEAPPIPSAAPTPERFPAGGGGEDALPEPASLLAQLGEIAPPALVLLLGLVGLFALYRRGV